MKEAPQIKTDITAEELEQLKRTCEDYLAGWKRAQADYANLKKDLERERLELSKYANERLLAALLPGLDQYDTALLHTPDLSGLPETEAARIQKWISGLKAVRATWESALQALGVTRVETEGAFDPAKHEAVGQEASEDIPEGHIIRTLESGWQLHDKLLRPARVIVSSGKVTGYS